MSEPTQEANGDIENESSASLNQSCSTKSISSTTNSNSSRNSHDGDASCRGCSNYTTATGEPQASDSSDLTNGSNRHITSNSAAGTSTFKVTNDSNATTCRILKDRSDEVTQESQQRTGLKCDIQPESLKINSLSSPISESSPNEASNQTGRTLDSSLSLSSTSQFTNDSFNCINQSMRRATFMPATSESSTTIDSNNNRNSSCNAKIELLSEWRRNNFSKSSSGSRLINPDDSRTKVCDCLSQNCSEKEHSNRRRFIESYYNNRTRLPSANAISTSNISTPLNRLSECDEITKRLLSSPIRKLNPSVRSNQRTQTCEAGSSRRASLGTDAMEDEVSLITSSRFNSPELSYCQNAKSVTDNHESHQQGQRNTNRTSTFAGYSRTSRDEDEKLRQQQQHQSRSLSVCQDDASRLRFGNNGSNHSVTLSRAVSLACEPSSSKQLLTIIPLFGCDMRALEQFINLGLVLPPPIESAVDYILAHGIDAIGIFRKSGVKSRILTLKRQIEASQDASFEEFNRDNEYSIYDIADLVKMWFRELKPMPLMTKDLIRLISTYLQAQRQADTNTSQKRGELQEGSLRFTAEQDGSLRQQIDVMISPTHRALICKAITLLATISSRSEVNQMTSQNLAICLTPSLCATESDQKSILVAQGALEYCIDNYRILF